MKSSESIAALAPAMVRALASMPGLRAEATNPFFNSKYVELGALIRETRPILAAEGLVAFQGVAGGTVEAEGGIHAAIKVSTRILHSSGEWIEEEFILPVLKRASKKGKDTDEGISGVPSPQDLGSAITYARRYALGAILGVASEEDDDGNSSSHRWPQADTTPAPPAPPPLSPEEVEFREERAKVKKALKEHLEDPLVSPAEREAIKNEINPRLKDLTNADYREYVDRLKALIEGKRAEEATAAAQAPAASAPARAARPPRPLPPGASAHEYAAPPADAAEGKGDLDIF